MSAVALRALVASLIIASSTALAQEASGRITLALAGGRLIDGYGGPPLENAVILIAGERIVRVGQESLTEVPPGTPVIDTNGMTIMPGLWESHGHLFHVGEADPGAFQNRFADQIDAIMAAVAKVSVNAGITSLRDFCTHCASTAKGWDSPLHEQQRALRSRILNGEIAGPRIYLSGPILSQVKKSDGGENRFTIRTERDARAAADRLAQMGADNIFVGAEIWDVALLSAIVEAAHGAGLGVDAESRHVRATDVLLQAGVDRIHVLFTADALAFNSEEELRELVRGVKPIASGPSANILRGPWYLSTLPMRQAYVHANHFPEVVEHPKFQEMFSPEVYENLRSNWEQLHTIPWGVGAEERVKVAQQKLARFIKAGGREQLIAATDVGAPLNFHSPIPLQLRNFVAAGLTPMEAIQSATLRPAQMQGVADQLGTVSVGKLADIIVVDGDPLQSIALLEHRVVHVVMNGRQVK
ncbi:MAG: amidohydrolase family protein [Xanthomonadales bacterium]|nr:amidohydrolase family protein [Xanthomonadales bacterium]